jgi:hypothetical protein
MATIPQSTLDKMTDRTVEQIVGWCLHHTAAQDQMEDIDDIASEEERDQGFVWAGYNFVVWKDGTIQVGRPITKVPAAQLGDNTPYIAICCEGNFQPGSPGYVGEKPSQAQLDAVIKIVNEWCKPKVPGLVHGIAHRDVATLVGVPSDATACPGDDLYSHMHDLRVATHTSFPS